jgi:hypothetical protein
LESREAGDHEERKVNGKKAISRRQWVFKNEQVDPVSQREQKRAQGEREEWPLTTYRVKWRQSEVMTAEFEHSEADWRALKQSKWRHTAEMEDAEADWRKVYCLDD